MRCMLFITTDNTGRLSYTRWSVMSLLIGTVMKLIEVSGIIRSETKSVLSGWQKFWTAVLVIVCIVVDRFETN